MEQKKQVCPFHFLWKVGNVDCKKTNTKMTIVIYALADLAHDFW